MPIGAGILPALGGAAGAATVGGATVGGPGGDGGFWSRRFTPQQSGQFMDFLALINGLVQQEQQQGLNREMFEDQRSSYRQTRALLEQQIAALQDNAQFDLLTRQGRAMADPGQVTAGRSAAAASASRQAEAGRTKIAEGARQRGTGVGFSGAVQEQQEELESGLSQALLNIAAQEGFQGQQLLERVEQTRQSLLAPLQQQLAQIMAQRPLEQQRAGGISPWALGGSVLGGMFGGPGGALAGGAIGGAIGERF